MPVPRQEEADGDTIAAEAYAEMEQEESGQPLPEKEKPAKSLEEPGVKDQPLEEDAEPSKEDGEEKADETQQEDKAEEGTSEEGGEEEEGKSTEEKSEDDQPNPEAEAKKITDFAEKHKLTIDEAKAELATIKALNEKYKGDPVELAKALLNTQRAYDKTKSEMKKAPGPQMFQRLSDDQFIAQARSHFNKEKEKHVEAFRARYPGQSEMLTDEAIIEVLAEKGLPQYKAFADKKEGEVKEKASTRREELLSAIDDSDKKFIPAVKGVLDKTHDGVILDETFDVEDLVRHARGEKESYSKAIKEAEERGAKREREKATIVGRKDVTGSNGTTKKKTGGGGSWAGTQEQKDRAEEMYSEIDGYTQEESYKMFRETFTEELKKNPRFVS